MKTYPRFFFLLCFIFSFTGKSQTASVSYADSLDGFDREAVKLNLLSNYIFGQEYNSCIQNTERAFINTKYNLSGNALPVLNSQSNGGHHTIGGTNTTLNAPCINEGFESTTPGQYSGAGNATAINSWTISNYFLNTGICTPASPSYSPGSSKAWIVSTPVFNLPAIGVLPNSPLGGSNVVQLNDFVATGLQTRMRQTFPVTAGNNLFQFAFAGVWQDGGHSCCTQAGFRIRLYDCSGIELTCTSFTFVTPGPACAVGSGVTFSASTVSGVLVNWTNWQTRDIDLTPFIGSCITVEVVSSDCTVGGHFGVTYFDSKCGTQGLTGNGLGAPSGPIPMGPVSFCAGSSQAIIQAPTGYLSYQWVSPTTGSVPANAGGTAQSYTVTNPVPGSVYTVNLTTSNGCFFTATYTIMTSNTGIAGTGTSSACSALAVNGTATVVAGGSSVGYNYSWTNASSVQVGTTSILSNVPPGNYTVVVTTPSPFAGCGSATANVTIPVAPLPLYNVVKYYCGTYAYLQSPQPGTNFKWYSNGVLIPAAQGGTAASYTVISPISGHQYEVSYLNSQGCQDSVKFTLAPSNGGNVVISNNQSACAGTSLGNATISLNPVTPFSNYSFTVSSTGTTASYSAMLNTPSYTYTATNLSAGGTYSVNAFDGSCFYSTSFTTSVTAPGFNYSLALSGPAVCSPDLFTVGINILNSSSYSYSWSPGSSFFSPTSQNAIVLPSLIPAGTSTVLTFTVVVTPTAGGCPLTKTLAVSYVNPPTPVIMAVPQLCSNSPSIQVFAFPQGGSFNTSQANSPVSLTGIISPGLAQTGVNTFTYVSTLNGCSTSSVGTYTVNAAPSLTISGPVITCAGNSVTWLATGADNYLWSPAGPGAGSFMPAATTIYTIIATNTLGNCSSVGTKTITVYPIPLVSVAGPSLACAGQYITWNVSGADIYVWSPATVGTGMFNAPAATTVYTLTGTLLAANCSAIITKMLSVDPCTGITSVSPENEIRVYPNPAINELTIETQAPVNIVLYNELGSIVLEKNLQSGKTTLDVSSYSSGIYLLKISNASGVKLMKLVKANH